jgi:membrane associated rhomboid family serine protease
MRDASVGFHCPECVKEGARSTRQARAVYGGTRVAKGGETTFTLIGLNVAVWLGLLLAGGAGSRLFDALVILPQSSIRNGRVIEGVSGGAYWQLVTAMFAHTSVLHIGFNMLALYFLGPQLEQVLGRARFLAVYLVSGFVGSVTVLVLSQPNTQTLGASGAIFGLMGALVVVALKVGADMRQILFWIGLNLVFTFRAGSGISWQGHVGGLVGGVVLTAIIVYAPRKRREVLQWTGIGVVLLASVVVAVVQALALA